MINDIATTSSTTPAHDEAASRLDRSGRRGPSLGMLATVAIVLSLLGACNTVEGVGEDVQSAGEGIEDAAESAKN